MKHLHLIKFFTLAFVILLSATSCSQDEISDGKLSGVTVSFKTISSDASDVFLEIEEVQVRINEDANAEGAWLSLETINTGVQNVNSFSENLELMLVDQFEMSSAYIYEIRLVLGDDNYLNINTTLVNLDLTGLGSKTPSNIVETEFDSSYSYNIVIELDLDASISFDERESTMVFNPKSYTEIRQIEY